MPEKIKTPNKSGSPKVMQGSSFQHKTLKSPKTPKSVMSINSSKAKTPAKTLTPTNFGKDVKEPVDTTPKHMSATPKNPKPKTPKAAKTPNKSNVEKVVNETTPSRSGGKFKTPNSQVPSSLVKRSLDVAEDFKSLSQTPDTPQSKKRKKLIEKSKRSLDVPEISDSIMLDYQGTLQPPLEFQTNTNQEGFLFNFGHSSMDESQCKTTFKQPIVVAAVKAPINAVTAPVFANRVPVNTEEVPFYAVEVPPKPTVIHQSPLDIIKRHAVIEQNKNEITFSYSHRIDRRIAKAALQVFADPSVDIFWEKEVNAVFSSLDVKERYEDWIHELEFNGKKPCKIESRYVQTDYPIVVVKDTSPDEEASPRKKKKVDITDAPKKIESQGTTNSSKKTVNAKLKSEENKRDAPQVEVSLGEELVGNVDATEDEEDAEEDTDASEDEDISDVGEEEEEEDGEEEEGGEEEEEEEEDEDAEEEEEEEEEDEDAEEEESSTVAGEEDSREEEDSNAENEADSDDVEEGDEEEEDDDDDDDEDEDDDEESSEGEEVEDEDE